MSKLLQYECLVKEKPTAKPAADESTPQNKKKSFNNIGLLKHGFPGTVS
jgi:hypothetical protein